MNNFEFIVRTRELGAAEEYLPVTAAPLSVQMEELSGTGAANDPCEIDLQIRNVGEKPWQGVIKISLPIRVDGREVNGIPRFFLPGFMYGTNRGEAPVFIGSKCAKIQAEEMMYTSPWWMVRSDRLSHPIALSYAEGYVNGFAASPYYVRKDERRICWEPGVEGTFDQYAGFGCSTAPNEVTYTLGYENAPRFFLDSHNIRERKPLDENVFTLAAGETITVRLHCFHYPAEDERGLQDAFVWTYNHYHQAPRKIASADEAIASITEAIARDAWVPENHSYTCFVFDMKDHFEYRLLESIAWTNGLAAAVPMLLAAYRMGHEQAREQALDCIEHIVKHSINEQNGLPWMIEKEGVWSNRGWWYNGLATPGHASYLVGQAIYLILKAWAGEKRERNIDHKEWLEFAGRVIERTETTRNSDGEYPYVMSEKTGAGLEYDSFSGSWLMAAAAYYALLTGDHTHVKDMLRSEKWYHDAYIRHMECYGGPLDISKGIDSEGILAYIRAVRCLHEITGDEILLDHMRDALHYEYTFKFCYNSPIKVPPLSKTGWSSCGGSITSVTNPHIHPMSSSILGEMAYYLQCREDAYIRSRYVDTYDWSCQCHNTYDGEYDYGKKGWMSERFCHSEGLLTEYYPDGSPASTWFALMPWACGSLLEGLCAE